MGEPFVRGAKFGAEHRMPEGYTVINLPEEETYFLHTPDGRRIGRYPGTKTPEIVDAISRVAWKDFRRNRISVMD